MVRPYVIIGTGAAGMAAAERLRLLKPDALIQMMSVDEYSHSRCMLHKFLGGERDEKGLSFVSDDFFEKNRIMWGKGQAAKGIDTVPCTASRRYRDFARRPTCSGSAI